MRSVRTVPANFLERIADPASRFHRDYLCYRRGEISRGELVSRLPHVAMLGDSVCTSIYISSALGTFWRSRRRRGGNWFLDTGKSGAGVRSVSKRLENYTPFVALEYAGVGAMVDQPGERQNVFRRLLGTRDFSGQVAEVLGASRFPDLILISIGHNNVDWVWRCPANEIDQPDERLRRQSSVFRDNFERQLRRLVEPARTQGHRMAIVVYGLVNFAAYFEGREEAERRRAEDPRLYPHLETTYKYFQSFRPVYRRNLVRLAEMANDELRQMVETLNREDHPNLDLRYSDALATAELRRAELLHAVDGWHPSVEGHNILADAAFAGLKPSLEFLGLIESD